MLHCTNTGAKISPLVPEGCSFWFHMDKEALMRTLNMAGLSSYGRQFIKEEHDSFFNDN